jgi:hypothetical protein
VVLVTVALGVLWQVRVEAKKEGGRSSDDSVQTPGGKPANT